MLDVVEDLHRQVHGLPAPACDLAEAAPHGNRPAIVAVRLPVGGDDRHRGHIPALLQVVVDDRLEQELVHIVGIVVTREGPDVLDEHAQNPVPRHTQQDDAGAGRPLVARPAALLRRGGKQERRAHTPDELPGLGRRDEPRVADISEAEGIADAECGEDLLAVDQRHDAAIDQIPIVADTDRIDRLDVEHVGDRVVRPDPEAGVVLKRQADHVTHRVL